MTTLTGNSRKREQRLQSLLLDRISQRYERAIAKEIRRVMQLSADLVERGQPIGHLMTDHKNNMQYLMNRLYTDAIDAFAKYFSTTDKMKMWITIHKRSVPTTQIVDQVIAEWLSSFGVDMVVNISDTTMLNIQNAIAEGIQAGLSEIEIADLISATAPEISASRARTIARTEAHRASNVTGFQTAKATGLEMQKVWVASGGSRTRTSHQEADGQKVGLDDYFNVGGKKLRFPADPSGGASETINCRCVLVYEFDD